MAAGAQAQKCVLVLLLLCVAAAKAQAGDHDGLAARIGRMLAGMRSLRQSGGSSSHSNKQATAAPGSSQDNPRRVTLDVTTGERSPDCVSRKVILISGQFQPTLTFTQGDWVEVREDCAVHARGFTAFFAQRCKSVAMCSARDCLAAGTHHPVLCVSATSPRTPQITVKNNIGADWPSLFDGISVHWHGFSMKGFAWMDGTKYVAQCPIARGSSFTYKFQVRPVYDKLPQDRQLASCLCV